MGKLFLNILATFAAFEADLIKLRSREGMAVARSKGKLCGKQPKLSDRQQMELPRMYDTGDYSISDLAELFSISRLTKLPALPSAGPPLSGPLNQPVLEANARPSPTPPADLTRHGPADA